MSLSVCELIFFLGITSTNVYSSSFEVMVLSVFGIITIPVYLLSMLREVFYGQKNKSLNLDIIVPDLRPRELFIVRLLVFTHSRHWFISQIGNSNV